MFAQHLCDSRIEYFRNAIDLNLKDRATCRVVAEGDLWGRSSKSEAPSLKRYYKSSFFNLQFSELAGSPLRGERLNRVEVFPSTVNGLTSRKRFGKAAPKGAAAGDSRPVPAGPDRAGPENPTVFP